MTATTTPDALDALFGRCPVTYNWVAGFTYRGRNYTRRAAGGTTVTADYAEVPVFNAAGQPTKIRVRRDGKVTVTSRYLVGGRTVPEIA
jgi:hypothetical protein